MFIGFSKRISTFKENGTIILEIISNRYSQIPHELTINLVNKSDDLELVAIDEKDRPWDVAFGNRGKPGQPPTITVILKPYNNVTQELIEINDDVHQENVEEFTVRINPTTMHNCNRALGKFSCFHTVFIEDNDG